MYYHDKLIIYCFFFSSVHINYILNQYARVGLSGGSYQGAHALINVWNPVTKPGEVSIAQIWLRSGPSDAVNTIEAGWIVSLTK